MNKVPFGYFKKTLFALLLLTITLVSGQIAQAHSPGGITPPAVPANLKAPTGELPVLKVSAKGAQIYVCNARISNPAITEWTLKAPDAELFNDENEVIGKHYAGPTWEAADGSKVVGEVKEKADSPDGKGIPWLLLKAKSNEGNGMLGKVSSIQRVETVAGLAPRAADCTQSSRGTEVRVNYSATYYFYSTAGAATSDEPHVPSTGAGGAVKAANFSDFTLIIALGLFVTVSLGGLLVLSISSFRHKNL